MTTNIFFLHNLGAETKKVLRGKETPLFKVVYCRGHKNPVPHLWESSKKPQQKKGLSNWSLTPSNPSPAVCCPGVSQASPSRPPSSLSYTSCRARRTTSTAGSVVTGAYLILLHDIKHFIYRLFYTLQVFDCDFA